MKTFLFSVDLLPLDPGVEKWRRFPPQTEVLFTGIVSKMSFGTVNEQTPFMKKYDVDYAIVSLAAAKTDQDIAGANSTYSVVRRESAWR